MALSSSSYVINGKTGSHNGYTVNAGHTVDAGILNRFISVLDNTMGAYNRVFRRGNVTGESDLPKVTAANC